MRQRKLTPALAEKVIDILIAIGMGAMPDGTPVAISNKYQWEALRELLRQTIGNPLDRGAKVLTDEFLAQIGGCYMNAMLEAFGDVPDWAERMERFKEVLRDNMRLVVQGS